MSRPGGSGGDDPRAQPEAGPVGATDLLPGGSPASRVDADRGVRPVDREHARLHRAIETQARRIAQVERDRSTLLAQTVFLGTLALLFVLPVVGGAYLGHWLDTQQAGYSYRWTMSGLVAGLVIGSLNVVLYIRRN